MKKAIDRKRLIARNGFRLSAVDPESKCGLGNKDAAQEKLAADLERLSALQDVFYAADRFALLIVFQGMDASGKDGAILNSAFPWPVSDAGGPGQYIRAA